MNITIKATRTPFTNDVRVLIEEKLSALERVMGEEAASARLEVEIEESISTERAGERYRAEGTLHVAGRDLRAEVMGSTLEAAVDAVRDDLAREVRSVRGKERSYLKRGGAALKRMLRFGR